MAVSTRQSSYCRLDLVFLAALARESRAEASSIQRIPDRDTNRTRFGRAHRPNKSRGNPQAGGCEEKRTPRNLHRTSSGYRRNFLAKRSGGPTRKVFRSRRSVRMVGRPAFVGTANSVFRLFIWVWHAQACSGAGKSDAVRQELSPDSRSVYPDKREFY